MKTLIYLSLFASLALAGCSKSSTTANQPAASGDSAMANAQNKALKVVDTASLNQAIQMFKVQEGRNPNTLDELVEKKVIPALPEPPAGMKYSYDPAVGSVFTVAQ
ncbi:hypothetical protein [Pedosphaera parvula]|uniref:Type II secretion system protein GspG C-terminal domain-containing protein n=1 Tax=Pedosphaera parvula (strain Ellin514) TaxID=320771 RepID=B9XRJ3_PEDPL|nr:hypothetical protein [Pedosphaera parvula]EEF57564.1 hypothetical protein Cflav_PD0614 [Pedosphaera parvula Ellin514]